MKPGFDNYAKTFQTDQLDVYFDNVFKSHVWCPGAVE